VAALKYQKGLGHLRTRPISRVVGKSMPSVGFRGKILDLLLNPTCLQRNLDPFVFPLQYSLKNTSIESLHHIASSVSSHISDVPASASVLTLFIKSI